MPTPGETRGVRPLRPRAYLITFHTFGTWLHGDDRGSVDRNHNRPGEPFVDADPVRQGMEASQLRHPPVILDKSRRAVTEEAIRAVCRTRHWGLHALHVRTNHVHAVVSGDVTPERIMNDLKSWATRRMAEAGLLPKGVKAWARHGSTRYLWNDQAVAQAIDYVMNQQGAELAGANGREQGQGGTAAP